MWHTDRFSPGMTRILFAALLFLPPVAVAQQPAAPPDYKALFEQANAVAAPWKTQAEQLQKDDAGLKDRIEMITDTFQQDAEQEGQATSFDSLNR